MSGRTKIKTTNKMDGASRPLSVKTRKQSSARLSAKGQNSKPERGHNDSGSRYHPLALENTCRYCDNPCGNFSHDNAVQCASCKAWAHIECDTQDSVIVTDLKFRKIYLCVDCKDSASTGNQNRDTTEESGHRSESSMDSSENFRAQYDPEQTQVMEIVPSNLSKEKQNGQTSTPVSHRVDPNLEQHSSTQVRKTLASRDSPNNVPPKHEKTAPESHLETKIDTMMDMMKDLQNNMNRIDTKTKVMDASNQVYLSATTSKLKDHVKTSVDDAFSKYEKDMKKNVETAVKEEVPKHINQRIDEKINQGIGSQVDSKINENVRKEINQFNQDLDNKIAQEE